MRNIISSSLFGFLALTGSFTLSACSFEANQDPGAAAGEAGEAGDPGGGNVAFAGPARPSTGAATNVTANGPSRAADPGKSFAPPPEPTAIGHACTSDAECESGACADGVCCDTSCDGVCESCNSPGQVGSCVPYANGSDPETECGSPGCGNGQQESFSCDGSGACQVQIDSCGEFACGKTSCLTRCSTDADCAEGARCNAGNCEPK